MDGILVVHEQQTVAASVISAFAGSEFSATAVETLDQALDYICRGGTARIVFYDGARPEVAWGFRRAQEANPALLDRLLIAISPLSRQARARVRGHDRTIDYGAMLLIARQLCRPRLPSLQRDSKLW